MSADTAETIGRALVPLSEEDREALIRRARMWAANVADVDALPSLLTRDEYTAREAHRLSEVRAIIEAGGYGEHAARLLDTDANASAARRAVERRVMEALGVDAEEAAKLLAAAVASASVHTIGRTAAQLLEEEPETPAWIVPGFIARGWAVKVAAREKTGKGTLVFYLLARIEQGKPTVFGDAYSESLTSLIYTEEPPESVREKVARFGMRKASIVYGWELAGAGVIDWPDRARFLAAKAVEDGHGLVFVDNLSRAAGVEDEAGVELARAGEVLFAECKSRGLTCVVDHHHKKGGASIEDKSRGGTALAGAVDNNVDLERSGDFLSRFRKVSSKGRMASTIWQRLIVLNEEGTGYTTVADDGEPVDALSRARLAKLRDAGEAGVSVREYMDLVEVGEDRARAILKEYVEDGLAITHGKRPARYYVSERGRHDDGTGGLPL